MSLNSGARDHFFGAMSLSIFLAAAVSGCASDNAFIQKAQELHSYTPCGMVMNAMMPHAKDFPNTAAETGAILGPGSEPQTEGENINHPTH
jgi:hypothetical protein